MGTDILGRRIHKQSQAVEWNWSKSGAKYTPEAEEEMKNRRKYINKELPRLQFHRPFEEMVAEYGGTPVDKVDVPIRVAYSDQAMKEKANSYFSGAEIATDTQQTLQEKAAAGAGMGVYDPSVRAMNEAIRAGEKRTAVEGEREFNLEANRTNAELELQSWAQRVQAAQIQSWDEVRRREMALAALGFDVDRERQLLSWDMAMNQPLPYSESQGGSSRRSEKVIN